MPIRFRGPCRSLSAIRRFFVPDEVDGDDIVAVTVDCADHKRVGDELAARFPNIFLSVDHHVSNDGYAEINFVLPEASGNG